MSVEITNKPLATPVPVGQYLVFTMYDDDTVPDKYVAQVFSSDTTNTDGSEVAKLYLDPNPVGRAHFDVSSIARGLLEFPLTISDTSIHSFWDGTNKYGKPDQDCILRIQVQAGRYESGTETLNQDSDTTFVLNGVEQVSSGINPSFAAYYPTDTDKKAWLTDRVADTTKITTHLASDDEAVACLMRTVNMNSTGDFTRMRLVAKKTGMSDQTTSFPVSASTTARENFIVINVSPSRLVDYGMTDLDKIYEYQFEPFKTSGGTEDRGLAYRVVIDDRPCSHEATQLAWINSRGGWDYLRFDSRTPLTVSVTGKQYRKTVGSWGGTSFNLGDNIQQYDTYAKTGKERYALRERFFNAEERELLRYLLQSPVVQMRVGTGEWEPCIVRTESLEIQPSGSQFYEVSVEVELARDVRC